MKQRLLAWGELLDASGWCVAFGLPGGVLWLSEKATHDLEERGGKPSTWEDFSRIIEAIPRDQRGLDRNDVKIWKSRGGGSPATPEGLTRREREVFEWLRLGKTGPEISIILGCAPRTVEKHMANLYKKIGVSNRSEAILAPSRHG